MALDDDDLDDDDLHAPDPLEAPRGAVWPLVLGISIVTCTTLGFGGVFLLRRRAQAQGQGAAINEQAVVAEYERLMSEGMTAYKAWSRARRSGDAREEARQHALALTKLTQAMDTLESVLARYRDGDGYLRKGYEGYEEDLSTLAVHIVDLEKGSTMRSAGGS